MVEDRRNFLCLLLSLLVPYSQAAEKESRGLIYRVKKGKTQFWLAGSVHRLRQEDYPMPAAYERAYEACSKVVFEVHPAELEAVTTRQRFQEISTLPQNGSLQLEVPEDLWDEVVVVSKSIKADLASVAAFRPWFAALYLTEKAYDHLGISNFFGTDNYYERRCYRDAKPIGGLESPKEMFDSLLKVATPKAEGLQTLRDSLKSLKGIGETLENLIRQWKAGDVEKLTVMFEEAARTGAEINRRLLVDRSQCWVDRISSKLNGSLVLPGFGHLLGKQGMVALLHAKGWEVLPA